MTSYISLGHGDSIVSVHNDGTNFSQVRALNSACGVYQNTPSINLVTANIKNDKTQYNHFLSEW